MAITTIFASPVLSVVDYRCTVGPTDAPFVETHGTFAVSYVRKGSFGCRTRGRSFELVAGSLLIGHPGDEYVCTHDHACGDECLSFHLSPSLADAIGGAAAVWRTGAVPPLAELMVLGELAQATAEGRSDLGLDELGTILAARFVALASGRGHGEPRAAPLLAGDTRSITDVGAGGLDHGAPGLRADYGPRYYAAFLIDPDGNNVEAVCTR